MKKARIEKLLAQTIGNYLRQHVSLIETHAFVGINKLTVNPNLDIVSVYLGIFPTDNIDPQRFLAQVMPHHHWRIRKYTAEKLRHVLRRIPAEIRFYLGDTQSS